MTRAAAVPWWNDEPAVLRLRCFILLLAASVLWGALAAGFGRPDVFALVLMPPYALWVLADLRARGVRGASRGIQLIVALVPFWGSLSYFVWTRRLAGVPEWLVFHVLVLIPAGLAAGVTHALVLFPRGGHS
ncbi:MAG: hypothetical protein WAT39_15545 [Planctomycetota bacterium]